jgi:hypothetical protein
MASGYGIKLGLEQRRSLEQAIIELSVGENAGSRIAQLEAEIAERAANADPRFSVRNPKTRSRRWGFSLRAPLGTTGRGSPCVYRPRRLPRDYPEMLATIEIWGEAPTSGRIIPSVLSGDKLAQFPFTDWRRSADLQPDDRRCRRE